MSVRFRRYFPGGLNHFSTDEPHNDAAHIVIECEPCLIRVRQMAKELEHER